MPMLTDKAAFAGETLTVTFSASENDAEAVVVLSDGTAQTETAATRDGGNWAATVPTDGLSGRARWIVRVTRADGSKSVVASGAIYLKPLVSKYRAVVAAIETALQNWGSNPNKQISVGELSITYKDRDELVGLLSYWRSRADADESGSTATSGPLKVYGGF